jgi:predicted membrane protein
VREWAKELGINVLALCGFAVAVVLAGIFMLYGLPLLSTWYGWVIGTLIIGVLVTVFDLDHP